MSPVPVIIAFYREHQKLRRCLEHLRAQTYPELSVFVRDNTEDNILFTAAVNEGLKKFCYDPQYRYVAVLNQDAYLAADALRVLIDFMERHPKVGVACPLQLNEHGQVTSGGSLQAFPFGVHRRDPLHIYREPFETPWGNGAALLIRTAVVHEIGVFDGNMRFICSDADFTLSARARGWRVFVVPEARCLHSLSSSAASDPELDLIKLRDAIYFAKKWVSGGLFSALSHEGPTLTRTGIRLEIDRMERQLSHIERAHAPSHQPHEPR